jgi:transcription elongation factor GreA
MEEKLYSEFKAERNFFGRAQTIRDFAAQKDAELDSEYFVEMFTYFTGYLKSYNQVNEQVVASYLLVKDLVGRFPHLGAGLRMDFLELYEGIEDPAELFLNLKDTKLKEEFLHHIKLFVPGWEEIFIKFFPKFPLLSIVHNLKSEGFENRLTAMTTACFDNFRDNREAVVWLFKNSSQDSWYKQAAIPFEKQLITLIDVLNISFREIENRRDTAENRKLNKQVNTILFKEGVMNGFIDSADVDTISRIYTFINGVKDLDPGQKLALRNRISKKYPDFKFFGDEEKKVVTLGLMVTQAKLTEKQKQLAKIINEDIPANSKELEYAKSLGDLSENAEYKAALENQDILSANMSKLKEEIDRAQLFDPSTVNTSKVSCGTKVVLNNINSGNKEEYTILGPWESDPDNGIISYLSPFGNSILNKTEGEQTEFTINGEKVSYTVETISAAI